MAKTGYTTQQLTVLQFGDFAEQQRKIMAGVHAGQANVKAERESQKALQDKENQFVINQYARVGELPEIGSATFDQNKDDFFNDQIDKYIKIKNGIDNGSVTADVGGRALAKINDQVKAFQLAAPEVLAQAKIIQEGMKIPYGEPGSISAVNPTVQQKILLDLIQGGDVRIVDNEGELILFQPAGVDSDGNKTEGGMINVNELINLEASGTEYVRKVPDLTNSLKGAFTGIVGEGANMNWSDENNEFMTIETIKKGDKEITTRTMTKDQRENIRRAIVDSKGIQPIIDNEAYMQSVWVDMMGKDDEWNPGDENKVFEALDFLANKAIDDNAAEVGIKQIIGMGTRQKGEEGSGSNIPEKGLSVYKIGNDVVSSIVKNDSTFWENQKIGGKNILSAEFDGRSLTLNYSKPTTADPDATGSFNYNFNKGNLTNLVKDIVKTQYGTNKMTSLMMQEVDSVVEEILGIIEGKDIQQKEKKLKEWKANRYYKLVNPTFSISENMEQETTKDEKEKSLYKKKKS